jgi:hypothetical protein
MPPPPGGLGRLGAGRLVRACFNSRDVAPRPPTAIKTSHGTAPVETHRTTSKNGSIVLPLTSAIRIAWRYRPWQHHDRSLVETCACSASASGCVTSRAPAGARSHRSRGRRSCRTSISPASETDRRNGREAHPPRCLAPPAVRPIPGADRSRSKSRPQLREALPAAAPRQPGRPLQQVSGQS